MTPPRNRAASSRCLGSIHQDGNECCKVYKPGFKREVFERGGWSLRERAPCFLGIVQRDGNVHRGYWFTAKFIETVLLNECSKVWEPDFYCEVLNDNVHLGPFLPQHRITSRQSAYMRQHTQPTTYFDSIPSALQLLFTIIWSQSTPSNMRIFTGTISSQMLCVVSGHLAASSGNFSLPICTETPQTEQNLCCWNFRPIIYALRLLLGSEWIHADGEDTWRLCHYKPMECLVRIV